MAAQALTGSTQVSDLFMAVVALGFLVTAALLGTAWLRVQQLEQELAAAKEKIVELLDRES